MFEALTTQLSLFDLDPEYRRPKYAVWFLGDRLPGLYSQHDVDAFYDYDVGHWRFKFQLVVAQPQPAYAYLNT